MARLSKAKKAAREKVDSATAYAIDEALNLVKEMASAKFKESVDVSVNLGVDPRKSDQVVRGSTVLPNGTGKSVRVAVFAQGDNAEKAKSAGADASGSIGAICAVDVPTVGVVMIDNCGLGIIIIGRSSMLMLILRHLTL